MECVEQRAEEGEREQIAVLNSGLVAGVSIWNDKGDG